MAVKLVISAILLLLGAKDSNAQSPRRSQELPKFMGHEVTVVTPETDEDGYYPKGPASVCVEGLRQQQCYTAPKNFGRNPSVAVVELDKDTPALLFSAASGGVSGWMIHFALLRPGDGKALEDLFIADLSVSNQSQHAFWSEPSISRTKIFVTADFAWGPDEGHYGEHRYTISAYVQKITFLLDTPHYYLADRYMTTRKYELDASILASERQEILARLRRVKAESERHPQPPR
jgi:hypothetical protein